jgi:uncharacterized membrane protein HdeD (DUF308 family)
LSIIALLFGTVMTLCGGAILVLSLLPRYRGTPTERAFASLHGGLLGVVGILALLAAFSEHETARYFFIAGGAVLVADAVVRWAVVPRLIQARERRMHSDRPVP